MPPGAVGCQFTAILATEWKGVINRIWNSEIPLIFARVVLTKTLGVRRTRDIRSRVTSRISLWDRGIHVVLVGRVEAERSARESRASRRG